MAGLRHEHPCSVTQPALHTLHLQTPFCERNLFSLSERGEFSSISPQSSSLPSHCWQTKSYEQWQSDPMPLTNATLLSSVMGWTPVLTQHILQSRLVCSSWLCPGKYFGAVTVVTEPKGKLSLLQCFLSTAHQCGLCQPWIHTSSHLGLKHMLQSGPLRLSTGLPPPLYCELPAYLLPKTMVTSCAILTETGLPFMESQGWQLSQGFREKKLKCPL